MPDMNEYGTISVLGKQLSWLRYVSNKSLSMADLPSLIHEVGDHVGECLGLHLPGLLQLVHVPDQQVIISQSQHEHKSLLIRNILYRSRSSISKSYESVS
jgi:hypothetical protein